MRSTAALRLAKIGQLEKRVVLVRIISSERAGNDFGPIPRRSLWLAILSIDGFELGSEGEVSDSTEILRILKVGLT